MSEALEARPWRRASYVATLPAWVRPRSSQETISSLASAAYPSRSASEVIGGSAYASRKRARRRRSSRRSLASAPMSLLRARASLAAAVLLAVSAVGLAACSGGDGDDASSSTTATAAPTTAAPVTTVPGGSDLCPWFRGSTTSLTSTGPTAPAFLIDATAGAQGCLDVVTLTFQSRGDGTPPGYTVGYRDEDAEPFKD